MKSNVDRVQVYLTLYIVDCLKRLQKSPNLESAINDMYSMSIEPFALPGDKAFPLNAFFVPPKGSEVDRMKKYLTQVFCLFSQLTIGHWESVLVVGGQQFAQIGNYFTIWKNLLLSIPPSKHNQSKIRKKCHDIPEFV